MTTLFIAVDESGREVGDDCYVVAACWFVSHVDDPEQAAKPTRTRTQNLIENVVQAGPPSLTELRGSDMPDAVDDAVNSVLNSAYDDSTLPRPHSVWPTSASQPIRYTRFLLFPHFAEKTIGSYVSGNLSFAFKTIALVSVLSPLFDFTQLAPTGADRIRVLLDADPWETPASRVEQAFTDLEYPVPSPSFEVRNSKSTPGIQFADLAAFALRQRVLNDECNSAAEKVLDHSL